MIPFEPIHNLLEIGPFKITAWGFMVAFGILLGLFIATKEAKRRNIDIERIYSIVLWAIIGGVIGGRLGYIFSFPYELASFSQIFQIWQGGLIWHSAFFGALLAIYFYTKINKVNLLKHLDVIAVGLPLGHAIGRIGCVLTGLHPGKLTNLPWAIPLNGQLTHPVAAYEVLAETALFFVIFKLRKKNFPDGMLLSFYVIGYSIIRFALDFLRAGDPLYYGLTVAQYFSIILFFAFSWFAYAKLKN